MENKRKLIYEAPETDMCEVVTESFLNGRSGLKDNVKMTNPFEEEGEDW